MLIMVPLLGYSQRPTDVQPQWETQQPHVTDLSTELVNLASTYVQATCYLTAHRHIIMAAHAQFTAILSFFRTPCLLITARHLNKPCHMFGSVPDLKLVVQTLELGSLPPKRGDKNIYFRVVVLRHRDLNLKCKYLRNESSYIGLHKRKDFFSTAKGHLHPAKFVVWPTIGWVVDG